MKRQAFTLVELIVVITILAVLWTIAFVSFGWYSQSARDSVRLTDLKNMQKVLSYYKLENGLYPTPDNGVSITFSGSEVWNQGVFSESVVQKIRRISQVPLDPLTKTPYTYSITNKKVEFQLWAIFEWDILTKNSPITSTYAGSDLAYSYIKGHYNGQMIDVQIGTDLYILAVPTIISGDISVLDLQQLINEWKLVLHGKHNLPASYSGTTYNVLWAGNLKSVNPDSLVVFSWSIWEITGTNASKRKKFIENLQWAYSGTLSSSTSTIANILDIDTSNSIDTEKLSRTIITTILNQQVAPGSILYDWDTPSWGACSDTCWTGTQTRTITCQWSNGSVVADSFCTQTKPIESQSCSELSGCTYSWETGNYGGCSASCGAWYQYRTVTCKRSDNTTASPETLCTQTKPLTYTGCNAWACGTYYKYNNCTAVSYSPGTCTGTWNCSTRGTNNSGTGQSGFWAFNFWSCAILQPFGSSAYN